MIDSRFATRKLQESTSLYLFVREAAIAAARVKDEASEKGVAEGTVQ